MSGSATIVNASNAFQYTDLQTGVFSVQAEFKASAAISAPRVVAIGSTGLIATAATDVTASLAIGVAIRAASAAGKTIPVVIHGIAENVPVAGAVAAGDILIRSVTTAGFLSASATPGVGQALAVAIQASASNVADVWVSKGV